MWFVVRGFVQSLSFKVEAAPISLFLTAKAQRLEVSQKSYDCFSIHCVSWCLRALAAILCFLLFGVGSILNLKSQIKNLKSQILIHKGYPANICLLARCIRFY